MDITNPKWVWWVQWIHRRTGCFCRRRFLFERDAIGYAESLSPRLHKYVKVFAERYKPTQQTDLATVAPNYSQPEV
jgi:hypothetical protein